MIQYAQIFRESRLSDDDTKVYERGVTLDVKIYVYKSYYTSLLLLDILIFMRSKNAKNKQITAINHD